MADRTRDTERKATVEAIADEFRSMQEFDPDFLVDPEFLAERAYDAAERAGMVPRHAYEFVRDRYLGLRAVAVVYLKHPEDRGDHEVWAEEFRHVLNPNAPDDLMQRVPASESNDG